MVNIALVTMEPNLEDELWLLWEERWDGPAGSGGLGRGRKWQKRWRAAALRMVTVKTPQRLSITTEMPASDWDCQALPSNRLVPALLLQPHLQPRFLQGDLLTLSSPISNQLVSFTISVSVWISSTPQSGLHTTPNYSLSGRLTVGSL